jgi:hypothetical protein
MSWLSKGIKKARKALHLPAITIGNAAKLGAAISTGGLGAVALGAGAAALRSKLKSAGVGGIKQIVRSKAEKALNDRIATLVPQRAAPNTAAPADTMPGGAPLRSAVAKLRRATHSRRARASSSPARASKRRAPTGGLDLKALSASWKAAGKPGSWMDWIRSHAR